MNNIILIMAALAIFAIACLAGYAAACTIDRREAAEQDYDKCVMTPEYRKAS